MRSAPIAYRNQIQLSTKLAQHPDRPLRIARELLERLRGDSEVRERRVPSLEAIAPVDGAARRRARGAPAFVAILAGRAASGGGMCARLA